MIVKQIYTGCLFQGAYYIESNGEAAIFDPLREVQPYMDKAAKDNAKIKYIKKCVKPQNVIIQFLICSCSPGGIEIKYFLPLLSVIYFLQLFDLQFKRQDLFIFAMDVVKLSSFVFSIDGA